MSKQQQQQQQQQQRGDAAATSRPAATEATTTTKVTTAATPCPAPGSFCDANGGESTVAVYGSFDDMPLHDSLLRGIYSHGFEKPSPIQQRAVVPMLRGGDVVAQAQSGTGKTGAFGIGVLGRCDFTRRDTQALILSPTRELAQQTQQAVRGIGWYMARHHGLALGGAGGGADVDDAADGGEATDSFCEMFVGGRATVADVKRLTRGGVLVAVGTPGRVTELIRRGVLRVAKLKTVVLDEADELLSQGFAEQVATIFSFMPRDVQIGLFSATLPEDVMALSRQFMRSPTQILMQAPKLTLEGLKQFYVAVDGDAEKAVVLADLYESLSVSQSVVFANTRRKVEWVAAELTRSGHSVAALHAEMERGVRERVMAAFRDGAARVLVTSDIVARGIDVQHVNMVVNVDMPRSVESYLHRIGRSARYGRRGIAINLIGSEHDVKCLREVEAHYRMSVSELPLDFMSYFAGPE